jgi:hypothetical protein
MDLAETMAQKVYRESAPRLSTPLFVSTDLFVMMRQAMFTVRLIFYLNADERRSDDTDWTPAYTFSSLRWSAP